MPQQHRSPPETLQFPASSLDRDLALHLDKLITASSLYTVLHALIEVCYRHRHAHKTGLDLADSDQWMAIGQRLTPIEESAARHRL